MVGDDDQSIYGFRGSDINAYYDFIKDHDMKIYKLTQNYRSTKKIVEAASGMVRKNRDRMDKKLFTENGIGDDILFYECQDEYTEANKIFRTIKACIRAGYKYKDIAILYRLTRQSRKLEDIFLKEHIPYQIVSGLPFYSRAEVKDMLAYLRLLANPNDEEAFKRAINTPKRGLGEKSIEKILSHRRELMVPGFSVNFSKNPENTAKNDKNFPSKGLHGKACCDNIVIEDRKNNIEKRNFNIEVPDLCKEKSSLIDACRTAPLKGAAKGGVTKFLAIYDCLAAMYHSGAVIGEDGYPDNLTMGTLIEELIHSTGYLSYLEKEEDEDTLQSKVGNLNELIEIGNSFTDISDFLGSMVVDADDSSEKDEDKDRVKLMTMHASKGLEFPVVIIAGMDEDICPFVLCKKEGQVDEERRLFYVAMTRAKEELVIMRPKETYRRGGYEWKDESRFIREIPSQYLKRL